MMRNGKNPTKIQLAMLAAYIDGEGCISIRERTGQRRCYTLVRIDVANTDVRLMKWLKDAFGASVIAHVYKNMNPRKKVAFHWVIQDRAAVEVLRLCLPYFVIKGDQARVAIAHEDLVLSIGATRNGPTREAYLQSRDTRLAMKAQLSEMKKSNEFSSKVALIA